MISALMRFYVSDRAEGNPPTARVNHTACVVDGEGGVGSFIVVFGGWDWQTAFRDVHVYDFGMRASRATAATMNIQASKSIVVRTLH